MLYERVIPSYSGGTRTYLLQEAPPCVALHFLQDRAGNAGVVAVRDYCLHPFLSTRLPILNTTPATAIWQK